MQAVKKKKKKSEVEMTVSVLKEDQNTQKIKYNAFFLKIGLYKTKCKISMKVGEL